MQEKLKNLQKQFETDIQNISSHQDLEELQKSFIGKKGLLNNILKGLKDLSVEEKKIIGPAANELKNTILASIENKALDLENQKYANIEEDEAIDVSLEYPSKNR